MLKGSPWGSTAGYTPSSTGRVWECHVSVDMDCNTRNMCKSHLKWLLGVLVLLSQCGILHAESLEDSLSGSDVTDVSDFIDLDDPFYDHDSSPEVKVQTTSNVNIDALVTEKTPPVVVASGNDVISDDDDDVEELSGAGSGSGMDVDVVVTKLNVTTLKVTDDINPTTTRSTPATTTTTTTTTTMPANTQPEFTTRVDMKTTSKDLEDTTAFLPTSPAVVDEEDEDLRDDGAADDSVVQWAIREGGIEEGEELLYETTSLRPLPSTLPTIGGVVAPTKKVKDERVIPDIIQEAGAGDGSPCDDVTCLYGGICKVEGDDVACVCPINCTVRSTRPVCGSDGEWYRNKCELQRKSCLAQTRVEASVSSHCQESVEGAAICPEKRARAVWGNWSPWVSSGDVDVRFRSCDIDGVSLGKMKTCRGPRVEVRSCNVVDEGSCKMWNDSTNQKFSYRCDGLDVRDIENAEMTFGAAANGGDFCRYSLYDLKRRKLIFDSFNLSQVVSKGHIRRWCAKDEAFLVSHTPLQVCKRHLQDICKSTRKCKFSKLARRQRNLGDFAHSCWKDFILGNRIPSGMSDVHSSFSFICQRFAIDSKWGKIFGHKEAHYGTIYDMARRIPVVSLVKVSKLGDDTWPKTDFMIERGLIDEPMTFSWLFKKEKGISSLADSQRCSNDWDCAYGMKQALPIDYDMSGYRIAHLMWPELVGSSMEAKLATFTLTNAAPMHPSLYATWRNAVAEVRGYAVDRCKIPVAPRESTLRIPAEMYFASGAVPSNDPETSIGNDVNVPLLFWMSACCFREDKVEAFAVFARNIGNSPVIVAPILQLESLLQDIYKIRSRDSSLRIFPAGDGACAKLENDISRSIKL